MTFEGLSREYILRTFGPDKANKVFPQYKSENAKGVSIASDMRTIEIAQDILNTIDQQGYIFERDIRITKSKSKQWKKSIQDILLGYGLQKVRLNAELKKQFAIESNGYPAIIIRADAEAD